MQNVQAATAGGYLQDANGKAFVVGGVPFWKHTTVGCDCCAVLIGSMRMSRG